jgi:hypothetical protein
MKTMFFKSPIFTLLMFAFVALSFTSCDKDDDTAQLTFKESIVGTWDIDSYMLDDDEWMGLILESGSVTFNAYTGAEGQFEQTVTFADEESFTLTGAYTVDEARKEVSMQYEDEIIVAQIAITDGNKKMKWESIQDLYPLVILATKR